MNNAFLVRLSISQWTGRKLDKSATRDTKTRAGANEKAGVKVYKSLISADTLDKIERIAGAARTEHQKRTVPWAYDGPGAITAEGYPAYKATMASFEKEFWAAVAQFNAVYETEREAARLNLGNMFNAADYPPSNSLTSRFAFNVSAEPMPEANHFAPVGLDRELVVEVQKDIKDNQDKALANANNTAWARVIEAVEKLKLRLEEYTSGKVTKFYESWIDNIGELVEMIPSVNVANDPDLARMAQRLTALTAYTAVDLKENVTLRDTIAKQAGVILAGINEAYRRAA